MDLDQFVSDIISQQLPAFYQDEGPNFVAFVRAYYEWMEQQGYTINASRNLLNYKDIDNTVDQFISSFSYEFLQNFPAITAANKSFLIKKIKDFYVSKGSIQGLKLLFRLLFDEDIEVYAPGSDILRASDGIWKIPVYLEVEHSLATKNFIGQYIVGSTSGATAFVDSIYTRLVNNRLIDVLMINDVLGSFLYNEYITSSQVPNTAKIIGSLTTINIVSGGANNKVGDLFTLSGTNGIGGLARVAAVVSNTGLVSFNLLDGGTGYANTSTIYISNTQLVLSANSSYVPFANVSQALANVAFGAGVVGTITSASQLIGQTANGYNSSNTLVANGVIVSATISNSALSTNSVVISVTNGDFTQAANVNTGSVVFVTPTASNVTATGVVTGSSNVFIGLHNVSGTFYANGAVLSDGYVTSTVRSIGSGSGASFAIQGLTDTESNVLFTDRLRDINSGGVPELNMVICGSNSNTNLTAPSGTIIANTASAIVTGSGTSFTIYTQGYGLYTSGGLFLGTVNAISNSTSLTLSANAFANVASAGYKFNNPTYGFPANTSATYSNLMIAALTTNTLVTGTILQLGSLNPGSSYTVAPFVQIRNDYISTYQYHTQLITVANRTGAFSQGDHITQTYTTPVSFVFYNSLSGSFVNGEAVTQSNGTSNSYATISNVAGSNLVLTAIRGSIVANNAGGQRLYGITSGATANIVTVSANTVSANVVGTIQTVVDSIQNIYEVRSINFGKGFVPTGTVSVGSYSNGSFVGGFRGTANVVSVYTNISSPVMGLNANVFANVTTSTGIATQLQLFDSGIGYQLNDVITLTSNTNPNLITGTANVYNQGIGLGYWEDNRGKLNSDKFLTDNYYYQDFSYEIQSRLSIDKYADILKKLAHVTGTKQFGKVTINSETIMNTVSGSASSDILGYAANTMICDFSNPINSGLLAVLPV
jgi:hypothetical protein